MTYRILPTMWLKQCNAKMALTSHRQSNEYKIQFPIFLAMVKFLFRLYWWLSGKEFTCQCRSCRLDPWVGKIPWRKAWQPIPVFLPGESPWTEEPGGLWGLEESDTHSTYAQRAFYTADSSLAIDYQWSRSLHKNLNSMKFAVFWHFRLFCSLKYHKHPDQCLDKVRIQYIFVE